MATLTVAAANLHGRWLDPMAPPRWWVVEALQEAAGKGRCALHRAGGRVWSLAAGGMFMPGDVPTDFPAFDLLTESDATLGRSGPMAVRPWLRRTSRGSWIPRVEVDRSRQSAVWFSD